MTEVERITNPFEIFFPNLGWRFEINPTAFTVFGIEIQWYGIIITIGLLLAFIWCFPKMKRFGLDLDRVIDVVIGGVIGGLIGARLYYVLLRWDEYAGDWKRIFNFRGGGLAIYGGLIGAIAVGLIICRLRKVKVFPMLDIACVGFLIGQGVGRWGNFVNQEAFGKNTDSLFAMTGGTIQQTIINEASYMDGEMYLNGMGDMSAEFAVHPCFLYESVWCIIGFILLSFFIKHRKYDGQMFLMYLTWYGLERFIVEGLRTDSLMIGNIRASQALSAVLVIASVIIQIVIFSKRRRDPESFVLYCDTDESKNLLREAAEKFKGKSSASEKEDADTEESDSHEADENNNVSEAEDTELNDQNNQEEKENGSDN